MTRDWTRDLVRLCRREPELVADYFAKLPDPETPAVQKASPSAPRPARRRQARRPALGVRETFVDDLVARLLRQLRAG